MKPKQCLIERAFKEECLEELFSLESRNLIELYFGDESGFCNSVAVGRAWQFRGEEIRIIPDKGGRLNVFGFLNCLNESKMWQTQRAVTSQFVVDAIDEWIPQRLSKPRILVLDNARIHRSRLVQTKLSEWAEQRNVFIFYLPKYSPHLNLIETLWRKMKYEWLKPSDYASFEKLKQAVKQILREIGKKYRIKFRDRTCIK